MTAQDLKNSILQLAVQGKLVPQCKEDEPASELTRQIIERRNQVEKNHIKTLSSISEEEISFDIPESWIWLRLGDFCQVYNGNSINSTVKQEKYSQKCDGHCFIATKDVGFDHIIDYENGIYIPKEETNFKVANAGSILLCMEGGSAGKKIGVLDRDVCFGNKLCCFTPYIIDNQYLYYYLQSPVFFSAFFGSMTGLIGGVGSAKLKNLICPIPPIAEQERIVEKIEELMPLVEEYGKAEEQLTKLNAEFPDKLRKSILQQAVQGKLTERDPADEPASELIKRIKTEKEALMKSGKIKKEKPLSPISDDEKPFDIPDTWEWVRLGDIVRYQGGYAYKSDTYVGCSNNQIIRLGNVKNNKLLLDSAPVFVSDHIACETEEYRIMPNTILFTMTGTKGKRDYFYTCCTTENNMGSNSLYLNQRVGCLKADGDICLEWLVFFLQTETVLSQIFATATGNVNQANIGSNSTLNLVLPIPPLAEQKRIGKRVEELLALCDELK